MKKFKVLILVFVLVLPILVSAAAIVSQIENTFVISTNSAEEEENETEESYDAFLAFYSKESFFSTKNNSLLLNHFVLEKRTNNPLREVFSPPPQRA